MFHLYGEALNGLVRKRVLCVYTILLSGGSGKRLWPLSGPARSKQYIRFLPDEKTGQPCSMVQRIWRQLQAASLAQNCLICAGQNQIDILHSQLGEVPIAAEPACLDTFPAVALSCAYLTSKMHARPDDAVCIMPVDPYTDESYFAALKRMPQVLQDSGAQVVLMGIRPLSPSGGFGYMLPERNQGNFLSIREFVEKPDPARAEELIAQGALWNGGVFCLRIGTVLDRLRTGGFPTDYDELYRQYDALPAISFDYAFVEHCPRLAAIPFEGTWKDIGSWGAVSKIAQSAAPDNCRIDDSCRNVFAVNKTNIPLVLLGVSNLVAAVSGDGILIADPASELALKQVVDTLPARPAFEEKSWGTAVVLDYFEEDGLCCTVQKITVKSEACLHAEMLTPANGSFSVLKGSGRFLCAGNETQLSPGQCVSLPAGAAYSACAGKEGLILILSRQEPVSSP